MNRGCRSPNPNAKAASVACQQQTASGLTMPEADSDEFNVANRPSTLWNEIEVATTEEDDRFPADGDAVDWLRDDAVDWLRKAPRPAAAQCWTTCLLPGHALAAALAEAKALLHCPGGGCTHWLPRDAEPRCALERLARAVMCFHSDGPCVDGPSRPPRRPPLAGCEWWVQVRGVEETLSIHWDCDEELKGRTGEHVPPYLATVTYLTSAGAPTIVLPVSTDERGRALVHHAPESAGFVSFPVQGKHLAFDGRLLHGAHRDDAPSMAVASHADLHDECPLRVTVLVNLWHGHQPMGVVPLADELRARLPPPADAIAEAEDWSFTFGIRATPVPEPRPRNCPEATPRVWRLGSFIHPPVRVSGLAALMCHEGSEDPCQDHFWSCLVSVEVVEREVREDER